MTTFVLLLCSMIISLPQVSATCSSTQPCSSIFQTCVVSGTTGSCQVGSVSCSSVGNCTALDANSICSNGTCSCKEGFSQQNAKCVKVLDRTCARTSDCGLSEFYCKEGKCACGSDWYEKDGTCVSIIGKDCNTFMDCSRSTNTFNVGVTCSAKKCVCKQGYTNENGVCKRILSRRCSSNTDCTLSHSECSGYGYCRCISNMTVKDNLCIPRLGSLCGEVYCSIGYPNKAQCQWNETCSCKHGYTQTGLDCSLVYGRSCSSTKDCGDLVGFHCDNNLCSCKPGFQPEKVFPYFTRSTDMTCSSDIGKPCSATNCSQDNTVCSAANICECKPGYFNVHGQCRQVLGTSCKLDKMCHVLNNTQCNGTRQCGCKNGFKQSGELCIKVLQSTCSQASDCPGSTCTGNKCACSSGQEEFEGKCLRRECAVNVPSLDQIPRRSFMYKLNYIGEFLIDDYSIEPGWYSIGNNSLPSTNPGLGYCGTYHPIYLADTLTDKQQTEMETNEIEVQASVGGLTETMDIKLRKCGQETQIYITQSPPRLSAFCIDLELVNRGQKVRYAYVSSSLTFKEVMKNDRAWHTPFLLFRCHLYEEYSSFCIVNWYANKKSIASYWATNSTNTNSTALHEDVLIAAGYKAGVKLMCSYQFMDIFGGEISGEYLSNEFKTGVWTSSVSTIYNTEGQYETPYHSQIGCSSADSDTALTCSLSFDIADENGDSVCSTTIDESNNHPLCGYTLLGLTHSGSKQYGNQNVYHLSSYKNGHRNYTYTRIRLMTDANAENNGNNLFKANFISTQSFVGHAFWDESLHFTRLYKRQSMVASYTSCRTYGYYSNSVPSVNAYRWPRSYGTVYIKSVGEFVFAHIPTSILTIHIRTEMCKDATAICVCSATIRDRNNIFTYGQCDGNIKVGSLLGNEETGVRSFNKYSSDGNYTISLSSSHSNGINVYIYGYQDDDVDVEGLCSAENGKYKWRSGISNEDSAGFVKSWMINYDESLENPVNHADYAFTETFYRCSCPDSSVSIPKSVLSYNSTSSSAYYSVIGAFQCTLDHKCTKEHQGKTLPGSLLPAYLIDSITIIPSMDFNKNALTLRLQCSFRKVEGVFYSIYWYIGDTKIKSCDKKTPTQAEECFLSNSDVQDGASLFIDEKIACETEVKDSGGNTLLGPIKSEFLTLIEINTTTIDILRTGEATLVLKNNLPLQPDTFSQTGGNLDWTLELTVYDKDDENCSCKDSSIAIKSDSGDICGVRMTKDTSVQFVNNVIRITLTTKNNNKYSLKSIFNLKLIAVLKIDGKALFKVEFKQGITVFVRNVTDIWQRKMCYANNDPRMKTFDGRYWYLAHVGIFVMYRHKTRPVEVQLIVQSCNGGWATCSCGVIIRAGTDLFIVNHCHSNHMTKKIPDPSEVLIVQKLTQNRYQVFLPHGTRVVVTYSPWRWNLVNVNIYASPGDVNNVVGLCGQLNGNMEDDFLSRDGSVEKNTGRRWWWWWISYPDDFPKSWRLNDDSPYKIESLLDPDNIVNLPTFTSSDKMCVCPGNHESEDSICSANEADTCTADDNLPGQPFGKTSRISRSDHAQTLDLYRRMNELRSIIMENSKSHVSKRSTNENALSEDEALKLCNATLNSACPAYKNKEQLVSSDANGTLLNCAADTAINPNISWTSESCSRMAAVAEMEASRDVTNKNKDNTVSIVGTICNGNCSGNGECIEGQCKCKPKFATDTCFIDITVPPEIVRVYGNGMCNPKEETCECIPIVTNGNADDTKCSITVSKATTNGETEVLETVVTSAVVNDLNEVECCYSFGEVRQKRSTGTSNFGYIMSYALSNDNTTFGNSQYVFVLDTTCQEVSNISGQLGLVLKSGYCYIDGVCYITGATNTGCGICDPTTDFFDWKDTCSTTSTQSSTEDADSGNIKYIIIGAVAGGVAIGIIVGVALIMLKKKKVSIEPNFDLYDGHKDTVANKKFKIREVANDAWM